MYAKKIKPNATISEHTPSDTKQHIYVHNGEPIFHQPYWVWPLGGQPYFILKLKEQISNLPSERCSLFIDGVLKNTVFPQGKHIYSLLLPLNVSCEKPVINIRLVNDYGKTVHKEKVSLWQESHPICVFNEDGLVVSANGQNAVLFAVTPVLKKILQGTFFFPSMVLPQQNGILPISVRTLSGWVKQRYRRLHLLRVQQVTACGLNQTLRVFRDLLQSIRKMLNCWCIMKALMEKVLLFA